MSHATHAVYAQKRVGNATGCHWGGDKEFQFQIDGISNSGDAMELNLCKWCGGLQVYLNKAPIAHKSKMQGELISACEVVQIMLFSMQVLKDIGLCVKKPMIVQVDCKGALDLLYGWNISELTKHVSVQACFLHELKEVNLLLCVWLPTNIKMVEMYTKNLSPHLYHRH